MVSLSPAFDKAVVDSKKLVKKPTNDHLLEMYALYKQAIQDPSIDKAEAPGTFDFKGKAKKAAWQKIVDEGVTPEQAQEQSQRPLAVNKLKLEQQGLHHTILSTQNESCGGAWRV
ncbi:hypothetical protein O988_08763 [Pseudogymnoascus sp. VKM F-3808]|nr:hypothetical protein O988_08763 [Pseudogymnoascus sp. VKM F-3808]